MSLFFGERDGTLEPYSRCECLIDITSCILSEEDTKTVNEQSSSPLKEPLKKKGSDINNPYPNFKVRLMSRPQNIVLNAFLT